MSLLPASGEFLLYFVLGISLRLVPGSYPLDLSGLGDPTGSSATTGLALTVTGTHKPLYHAKVEIPTKGEEYCNPLNMTVWKNTRTKLPDTQT
jgi:hypothetical protein